jgi:hypothetical protein
MKTIGPHVAAPRDASDARRFVVYLPLRVIGTR